MAQFELGQLLMTRGVANRMEEDGSVFEEFVWHSLRQRYIGGDWGDLTAADKSANNEALENGGRILAAYEHPDHAEWRIWIITEADRSSSTILFPDEY